MEWIFDGTITIDGEPNVSPVRVYRSGPWTSFRRAPAPGLDRQVLTLTGLDRQVFFFVGDGEQVSGRARTIVARAPRTDVGHHEDMHGHPADNERVVRRIPRMLTDARFAGSALALEIQADTLPGELSREDGFTADRSPWSIRVSLVIPRIEVAALFALSERDAALVDRCFDAID